MTRTIYRERIPATDPRLGRHVHHDSRSRAYVFDTTGLTIGDVDHTRRVSIFDQGNLGSCTGNAGIGCLATDPFRDTLPANPAYSLDEVGAVDLYSDATRADGYPGQYPPDDTGSDGLTIAKVLTRAGLIAGYQHTFTLDDALKALTVTPLITGTVWYKSMFTPTSEGVVPVVKSSGVAGGHEYEVVGYDQARGLVRFANSWGTSWGDHGYFWMAAEDWGALLAQQGDVTVFTPVTAPAPTPTPQPSPADDADRALATVAQQWIRHPRILGSARLKTALNTWLAAKGFNQ